MRLTRYLKNDTVDLAFDPFSVEEDPWASGDELVDDEESEELSGGRLMRHKEQIIGALVDLMAKGGRIPNTKKCTTDLRNREARASTGLGLGIALPHVRTMAARGFTMGVAIAPEPGLEFDSIDGEPVRIFITMVAPSHDDRFYLKVERALAGAFADEDSGFREELLACDDPGKVIRLLSGVID
jgi:mannitol/fructose-specific phosphotransferase system IIA component (Ntr-type)